MNVVNKIAASKYFQQVSRLFDCFLLYFIKYKKNVKRIHTLLHSSFCNSKLMMVHEWLKVCLQGIKASDTGSQTLVMFQ